MRTTKKIMSNDYTVEISERQPQRVASMRAQTTQNEIANTIGEVLPQVWKYITENGGTPAGAPFVRYNSYSPEHIDLDAGIPYDGELNDSDQVKTGELPGGRVATTLHVGHYDQLEKAWTALTGWVDSQGLKASGAPWESYLTDPGADPDPATWKTEIVYPLQ